MELERFSNVLKKTDILKDKPKFPKLPENLSTRQK
jgi:hypothetical protein